MALLFGRQRRVADLQGNYEFAGATAADLIPSRSTSIGAGLPVVNSETAMRHSAVWACLRLRANLISTLPVDVFRKVSGVDGSQVELPKPPILRDTGGDRVDFMEWRYSTQIDLDRVGNSVGVITQRSQYGLPATIELVPIYEVSLHQKEGKLKYKIGQEYFDPASIWHEKQYTFSGLDIGLSPLAYAAWSIGEYLSIQDFALSWFGGGGVPRGHLRNKQQTMTSTTAAEVKDRFKATVSSGDVFVTGADWDYSMLQAEQTGSEWIDAKKLGLSDVARYFDVPGDLIDAAVSGQSVTYASITQRNLQFLIMNLGPAITRRENAWTKLIPGQGYVKLNTDALLRMDPLARAQIFETMINARVLAPSEARALDDRKPFTDKQISEFDRLFGSTNPPPAPAAAPSGSKPKPKPGDNTAPAAEPKPKVQPQEGKSE